MEHAELYTLPAGRDTDALIAEHVYGGPAGERFSTEIGDALLLWDLLALRGWQCSLVHKPFEEREDDRWVFHGVKLISKETRQRIASFSAHAGTRELAIARGAMAAEQRAHV